MKSWKTPTAEQIQKALASLPHVEQYRYFFDQLKNPRWIKPLHEKGFFLKPPPVQCDEQRGTVGFPPWPESKYLARMAAESPEEVLKVILETPSTDNVRVHEDFADAALMMPVGLSAKLAVSAKKWLAVPYQLSLPRKLTKLVVYLAKGGENEPAFALAGALLEILPDPKPRREDDEYHGPDPKPRLGRDWNYQEAVRQVRPALFEADPEETFTFFSDQVVRALELSKRPGDKASFEDYSSIWVEDVARDDIGFKDVLVSAVRDTAVALVEAQPSQLNQVVEKLEERRWVIFQRIALYLLRRFPEASAQEIAMRLTNRKLFNKEWREYKLLARDKFGVLPSDQQQIYLGWVDAGPDMKYFSDLAPENREKARKYWQAERLSWVKEHLPAERKGRLATLVAETKEPEPPDAPMMTSWSGPTSPKSTDELKAMTPEEIVRFLREWQPPETNMDHSREGLARMLSPVVAEKPAEFAAIAKSLEGLDPTYVRACIVGFESAAKEKKSFDWEPVLDLCGWVVSEPREIPGRSVSDDFLSSDPDWGWTRKHIAWLIHTGCKIAEGGIPFCLREKIKELLIPLTEDPDPTLEDETGEGEMDPLTLSINTARGEAMHAVFQYALWIIRCLESDGVTKEALKQESFARMPEVRQILEDRLDPVKEPTATIRAVYGQWFPWIILLDKQWARQHVRRIFYPDGEGDALAPVAWNTYLRMNQPYDEAFEILADRYSLAVEKLNKESSGKPADEEERLAQHLMVLAWRGKLPIEGASNLWANFWAKAAPSLRAEAIEFIGRAFYQTKGEVSEEYRGRAMMIWAQRMDFARAHSDETKKSNELSGFGWWFASSKFDDSWALPQLVEALGLCSKPDADHFIATRLAQIAKDWPLQSIQALTALFNLDREGWGIAGWANEARHVIQAARDSGNSKAREMAIDLIHRLGALGHLEFRDLLPAR